MIHSSSQKSCRSFHTGPAAVHTSIYSQPYFLMEFEQDIAGLLRQYVKEKSLNEPLSSDPAMQSLF
jgi:hypothetical protein